MSKAEKSPTLTQILDIISRDGAHVHFIGVGGAGMSSLLCLTEHFGIKATGSDIADGENYQYLLRRGAGVYIGASFAALSGVTLCVRSLAVKDDDAEVRSLIGAGVPVITRGEYLAAISTLYSRRIAVSGSHGKSSVTAMTAAVFLKAGLQPTVLSGARLSGADENFVIGSLDYLIYEACEYRDSFLFASPTTALFLNLELDHTDYFSSCEMLERSFLSAMNKCRIAIVNTDDSRLLRISSVTTAKTVSVGTQGSEDYFYKILEADARSVTFSISQRGRTLGKITLFLLGAFNALNGAMSAACAIEHGVPFDVIKTALEEFRPISRRLEFIGELCGMPTYYDYAHHPTEIRAGIDAVRRAAGKGITLLFLPHTYSRTEAFFEDFVSALSLADLVLLAEITGAREEYSSAVSSRMLGDRVGGRVIGSLLELEECLRGRDGVLLIMGAGDSSWIFNT